MQVGFALVENGSVRPKNSKNILLKNLIDVCVGGLFFWLFGFGIAYGSETEGSFIGTAPKFFASSDYDAIEEINPYTLFIFQFSFAATSATIVSGSLAERAKLPSYILFSILMTSLIYPIVAHWVWGKGWLYKFTLQGEYAFHDFAGSGVVHATGGITGMIGAAIIGPRHGKEKDPKDRRDVR